MSRRESWNLFCISINSNDVAPVLPPTSPDALAPHPDESLIRFEGLGVLIGVTRASYSPATIISATLIVGPQIEPRNSRSLPTISTVFRILPRLPEMVISETG